MPLSLFFLFFLSLLLLANGVWWRSLCIICLKTIYQAGVWENGVEGISSLLLLSLVCISIVIEEKGDNKFCIPKCL